jgi:tetratricopeptide (TPR) repeat protein
MSNSNMPFEQQTNSIKTAIDHGHEMLAHGAYQQAEQQGREILKIHAHDVNAQYLISAALRAQNKFSEAQKILKNIIAQTPKFAQAHQELGFVEHALGNTSAAIDALKKALKEAPKLPLSWRLLSELLLAMGEDKDSQFALNQSLKLTAKHPAMINALQAFMDNKLAVCERLCRQHLKHHSNDVNAIRLLAEVAIKLGIFDDAEKLLKRCLTLAPDYHLARLNYAHTLNKREKCQQALVQIDYLEKNDPNKTPTLIVKAAILVRLGDFKQAIEIYDQLTIKLPRQANLFTSRGHALKTVGNQDRAIASYRQAIICNPNAGEAYWSLANLKTFRFSNDDIKQMKMALTVTTLDLNDKAHICFALGKALEDGKQYDLSFQYYQQGNQIKNKIERYSADDTERLITRCISTFDKALFKDFAQGGCQLADPIFIVGLPRSGSTLLEQILASHSQVDGTKELPDMLAMVRRLSGRVKRNDQSKYPEIIATLSDQQLIALGEEYLERTRIQRQSAKFFIDKMPNNFAHIGLIKKILPNAKIIDARRHPMSSCFSGYKQLFATGQAFTYDQKDIGRYYIDYKRLMDHWHTVLPEQVLTIHYEDVVNDFEPQVRRILDFCGLPFETQCLEFYKNDRAVKTASSEQVRQPIYKSGLQAWSPYQSFLSPLMTTLSPLLDQKD